MNALIIRFSSLGDIALSIPVIYNVVQENPDIRFSVLTKDQFAYLFDPIPNLNINTIKTTISGGILKDINHLLKKSDLAKYDMIFDLHGVLRSQLISSLGALSKKKVYRIDKNRKEKLAIINGGPIINNTIPHILEAYREVFLKGGLVINDIELPKHLYGQSQANSPTVLQEEKVRIGIAPFAHYKEKTYPENKMIQVICLLNEQGISPYIFGGKNDKIVLDKWLNKIMVHNCIGLYSGIEELQKIQCLDLMVSMDSANVHLSRLVNTSVLTIWGATHPSLGFGGWGMSQKDFIQISRDELTCRPCSVFGDKTCRRGDFACMETISPRAIVEKIFSRIETI